MGAVERRARRRPNAPSHTGPFPLCRCDFQPATRHSCPSLHLRRSNSQCVSGRSSATTDHASGEATDSALARRGAAAICGSPKLPLRSTTAPAAAALDASAVGARCTVDAAAGGAPVATVGTLRGTSRSATSATASPASARWVCVVPRRAERFAAPTRGDGVDGVTASKGAAWTDDECGADNRTRRKVRRRVSLSQSLSPCLSVCLSVVPLSVLSLSLALARCAAITRGAARLRGAVLGLYDATAAGGERRTRGRCCKFAPAETPIDFAPSA